MKVEGESEPEVIRGEGGNKRWRWSIIRWVEVEVLAIAGGGCWKMSLCEGGTGKREMQLRNGDCMNEKTFYLRTTDLLNMHI